VERELWDVQDRADVTEAEGIEIANEPKLTFDIALETPNVWVWLQKCEKAGPYDKMRGVHEHKITTIYDKKLYQMALTH
jgi:hypothetical protein